MDNLQLKSIIECLLFVSNKPLVVQKIAEIVGVEDTGLIKGTLNQLQQDYNQRQGGLQVIEVAGGYQLCTRSDYSEWIKKLDKIPQTVKLSASALETLAIIAYKQPLTKNEIEKIRGVDTSGVIYSLLEKKFIRVAGRKDCMGRPILYSTTNEFLRYFGLKDINEIPMLEDLMNN